MRTASTFAICLIAACAHINSATAQNDARNVSNNGIKVASNDDARCKKDVTQYTEAFQFLRQSAGEQLSTKVMSSYVPIDQLNQVVASSGHCAGAQLLRDKKAPR